MNAEDRLRLIRAKIERAEKHLDDLEAAVLSLGETTFKTIGIEFEPDTGKPILQSSPLHVYGFDIPILTGDVVHNLRCALDHLAFQLVTVGITFGESRTEKWADIQFPIFHSLQSYEAGKIRRIQGARREAIEAIDRLKPYKGKNDALWLLSKLDNTDKHSFILPVGEDAIIGGISLKVYEPYFASLGIPKENQDVNLAHEETLIQPSVGGANALLPTLHQLTHLVSNIVVGFQPLLESPAATIRTLSSLEEFDLLEWPGFPK